jgi:hypothetical protein
LWMDLLNVSGGELSISKCTYHFTYYNFTPAGIPVLTDDQNIPISVLINGENKTVKRLSPYKTHKTLGCHNVQEGKMSICC